MCLKPCHSGRILLVCFVGLCVVYVLVRLFGSILEEGILLRTVVVVFNVVV